MPAPLWLRTQHTPTEREAWVSFACLSAHAISAPAELDPEELGLPDVPLPSGLSVTSTSREDDPSWAELLLAGEVRALAGDEVGDLAAMRWCHSVTVSAPDAADLAPLQVAWALARYFVMRGATAVFDEAQLRWFSGDEVRAWPPARPFVLERELNVVGQQVEDGWLFFTRGLVKCARPELVVRAAEVDAGEAEQLVGLLARASVDGRAFEHDDVLEVEGAPALAFTASDPERGDTLVVSDLDAEGYVRRGVARWAAVRRG